MILAISGSTREFSTNLNLINAAANLASDRFNVTIYRGLLGLPHFNPDNDNENVGEQVADLRRQLREADGVLICTPEYRLDGFVRRLLPQADGIDHRIIIG